jgi:ribosomal protein RSM22 (predicted rRNA methylase)
MQFPVELSQAIEAITADFAPRELARAAAELTTAYRGQRKARPHLDRSHRAAYLITRLPATYAVLARILQECKNRIPDLRVGSMLDLGAGPGTALWAAASQFPELERATLVEDDTEWIAIGQRLAQSSQRSAVCAASWHQGSITDGPPSGIYDLVTISYTLNELRPNDIAHVLREAWQRTGKILAIVEPGTPIGFGLIRTVRAELIAEGAFMVAPCPHARECPMPHDNWCHFAERLPRNAEHRHAKSAELGYEDEKFSYVVFAREPAQLPNARILRHPRKHSGHVELELCTKEGLKRETVSRKLGKNYKQARKAEWGDEFLQDYIPPSSADGP